MKFGGDSFNLSPPEIDCRQELDAPCAHPDSYPGEVNLKAGGRGYIADNFSAQALSVRVKDGLDCSSILLLTWLIREPSDSGLCKCTLCNH
jgi:hypothetical protein